MIGLLSLQQKQLASNLKHGKAKQIINNSFSNEFKVVPVMVTKNRSQ
jgi:hypothetical protein